MHSITILKKMNRNIDNLSESPQKHIYVNLEFKHVFKCMVKVIKDSSLTLAPCCASQISHTKRNDGDSLR